MRIRPTRLFTVTPRVIHRRTALLDIANNLPALNPAPNDDIPFPPIPSIRSVDIRTKVFTHRSFHGRPSRAFEDNSDDPSPDNENYELLGDSVIRLAATNLLQKMYPNLRVGPCTQIRDLMVSNRTLAAISCRYALPAQLNLHPAQENSLRATLNVQADIFESYVGGLYHDQGLSAVEEWLKALFKAYAIEAYVRIRNRHSLPPLPPSKVTPSTVSSTFVESSSGIDATSLTHPHASIPSLHLSLLNEQIQKEKRKVKFNYIAEGTADTPTWIARVEVDGKVFGHGKGGTKKAARNEAAKEGLVHMGIMGA